MTSLLRQSVAALRLLLVLTVALGVGYPLVVYGVARIPGLAGRADGSLVHASGRVVGSSLLGQSFTTASGQPLPQYFQSRPSAGAYDPTASGASNLGPESVVDTSAASPSLLTRVCTRSVAIGRLDGVDGSRPYCTTSGVGAVLAVYYAAPGYRGAITRVLSVDQFCPARPFLATYRGVRVTCRTAAADVGAGRQVLVRGSAPAHPAVPADAVTASGSGLDPDISPAYARIQQARVARARGVPVSAVHSLVTRCTTGRALGFLGEPVVDVLLLNLTLDRVAPIR